LTALPPFQALLDEHAANVMAVLRGAVGAGDAEDCFQETFLAALRAYPKLSDARNLRGWLLTIAHRKAVDHHRANGRRPLPVGDVDKVEADEAGREDGTLGKSRILVEDGIPAGDGTLVEDGIWVIVAALPPRQRAAVALRYACDLPHAEIAAALGCSPAAARRSLHEGMKRLRADLGGERAPEADPGKGLTT
jgi:RNA polymerase sigma factor (sigma-70 family)